MSKEHIDIVHDYIKSGRVKNIQVLGEDGVKTFYHGVNENTKLKYILIVFDIEINFRRPLNIYNQHIKQLYYNESKKLMKIELKEEQQ